MKIGLLGCGNIGAVVANAIKNGKIPDTELVCVLDRNINHAKALVDTLHDKILIADHIDEMLKCDLDIVVETASQEAVREYIEKILNSGVDAMILSVGALVDTKLLERLNKICEEKNCRIYVPSGAICGLDAVKAASVDEIYETVLTTRKPPKSLGGIDYLRDKGVDVEAITEPTTVYEGPVEEAVKLFPKNINVSAALSIAGVGPKKTTVRVIVDPSIDNNIHEIYVRGAFGELTMQASNVPSPNNPHTSYLACLSAVRTLTEISQKIRVGT